MQSNELSVVAENKGRSRSDLRPGFGPNLRVLLMLGICGFPLLTLYAMADSRRSTAHAVSSSVVSRVRISRSPAATRMLVRSPQPPPVPPKTPTLPVR